MKNKTVKIFDELAYKKIPEDQYYRILQGSYSGEVAKYKSSLSYSGDIDGFELTTMEGEDIFIFLNVLIEKLPLL